MIDKDLFQNKWIGKNGLSNSNASTRLGLQAKILDINWDVFPDQQFIDDISALEDEIRRIQSIDPPPVAPTKPNFDKLESIDIQVQKLERKLKITQWEVQTLSPYNLPSVPKDPPPIIKPEIHIPDKTINVKTIELPNGFQELVANKNVILNPTNDFEYLFTVIADPIETTAKAPLERSTTLARRIKPEVIPKDTLIPAQKFKDWMDPYVARVDKPLDPNPLKIPFLSAKLTYRVTKAFNDYFKTNTFSSMKPIRYIDICDNVVSIDSEIMLRHSNNAQNFVDAVVEEIMLNQPEPDDELRLRAYEDIFMDIYQFPVIFTKSQLDNRMVEMLMEQRRRGVVVDLEYAKKYISYENLNIMNQLNYQYLFSNFQKIENLLVHQISIIQKNHMVLV